MIKTLRNLLKQDKERFVVPRGVQDVIPIKAIYDDGVFQVGRDKFSKTYKFSDINYAVASREDKEAMFLEYSELLNSLDSGATTKITINNRHLNRADFEKTILLPLKGDALDEYREEYNRMLLEKATGANSIIQEKYITISVCKKNVEEARNYFARVGADLIAHFGRLGSKCVELEPDERLRIFHDFYRAGEETEFRFDIKETRRKGHDFKDFICPDSMEFTGDYFKIGERYGRVLFLREYASYIKDSMVAEMTDLNRNLMMSIDVIPVPTDEAVREAESRLLGVETNATNWQRRQNANNNFSAQLPYDIEQQRKEMKEFLDDLTTRDQRMMFAVLTMVHTADTKEQLDNDTEALLTTARKHLCQFGVLKFQQLDGLNTAMPFGVRKIESFRTLTTESLAVFIPFRVQDICHTNGVYYELFVKPSFGKNRLVQVKKSDVRKFYNSLADGKVLKIATIDNVHNVLHQVFQVAVDDGMIRQNPTDNMLKELKLSHGFEREKKEALTVAQQKLFFDYMLSHPKDTHWYPVFYVMANTGMRVGEITGLRWSDIDLKKGIIRVNHTLVYYNHRDEKGCYFSINTPKTKAGEREIPMTEGVKQAFLMEREFQSQAEISSKSRVDGYDDFIFVNRYGDVQNQGNLNKALRRMMRDCNDEILEKYGADSDPVLLPQFSCHILRHTFATRLCESGANLKFIQSILGHADVSTTMNIYVDVTDALKKKEITAFDDYMTTKLET